jgi:hypothetical protein
MSSEELSNKRLEALRHALRNFGRRHFPALREEIDDLTGQTLSDLWEYLEAQRDAQVIDADSTDKIAFAIFKRRAVDVFRKRAKKWALSLENLSEADLIDDTAVDGAKSLLYRRMLRICMAELADFSAAVEEQLALGFAGHDPTADKAMRDFLAWFIRDPDFGTRPAWLLDTGDLSAIGDQHSIAEAKNLLGRYKSIIASNQNSQANNPVGANALLFSLYGNHDAWPETFPLWAHPAKLDAHRNALRNGLFPPFWPQGPLSIPIPHTKSRLMLHGVNSAIDDRWDNTFALGKVEIDPAWTASVPSVDQLQHLAHGVT